MSDISESGFETQIEEHLIGVHGYRQRDGRKTRQLPHYDPVACVDRELLLAFIIGTQKESWEALKQQHGAAVEERFLHRLTQQINQKGTLHVLRNGIKDYGCFFNLAYFRPASTLNPEHQEKYGRNILSVMCQCHYSTQNNNSIDLVLFLNGLPIITVELKNKLTGQRAMDAILQYQRSRELKGEPLLQFKRCLVHFAVDGDEVYMTTRLQGQATYFLPFNRGRNGGAGNPINPHGYASSYLWEEIWQRDNLLELIGSFIHLQEEDDEQGRKKETLIFPRYHQWDVVRQLLKQAREHGPGENYLIQHSAGSGKSNSIAWLAHRLASLHNTQNQRVFDSVIVITDRRVLDRQLRNTVKQFEQTTGIVNAVEKHSDELATALTTGSPIIITTLQKFPVIAKKVRELAGRNFAIIADEAHSSQSGESSKEMKAVLRSGIEEAVVDPSSDEIEEFDLDPMTGEDLIAANMEARGRQANLSFFAFTATPKPKTLELFGIRQPDGKYRPFHLYSMRQAIEERFILDVLENYTTYITYFNLLKKVNEDPRYPKSQAINLLRRYVEHHQHTIAQKSAIIIEHFWENTRHKIPDSDGSGQAKAMLVTRSRLQAVRYKLAFDKYLQQRGYPMKALVAFSGEIEDGGCKYTEANMNGFSDRQTAEIFKKTDYRFIIVAEKFQTGFDQPLLHTMYIDKKLANVNAVQTLSRLNRTRSGKTDTLVMDFVNDAEQIQKAFQPYYETSLLSEGTDPNKLYDLHDSLAAFELYTVEQVSAVAELFLRKGEKAAKLQPLLRTVVERYNYLADNQRRLDFKSQLASYIRLYAFLSQIIPFRDADLERLYLFARLLLRSLPRDRERKTLNLAESTDLESYRIQQTYSGRINLDQEENWLTPFSDLTSASLNDPEQSELSKIIAELNERFGTAFDEGDRVFFAELKTRLVENESLRESAKINSRDNVRLLHDALFTAVLQTMIESNFDLFKRINDNEQFAQTVRTQIFDQVYRSLQAKTPIDLL